MKFLHYLILLLYAPLAFFVLSANAKEIEYLCVTIPERQANPNDPFNAGAMIPSANLNVRIEGKQCKDRPTIVFIHGFSENLTEWDCAQKSLKDHYRTIAFDLRGYGKSSRTPAPFPPTFPLCPGPLCGVAINYSIQVFADDLLALLGELGVTDNIILVGHSLGTGIALNYATSYPGVKKLVLVSGAPLYFVNCSLPLPQCVVVTVPNQPPACESCFANCNTVYPPNPGTKNPLYCSYPGSGENFLDQTLSILECVIACEGNSQCETNCVLDIAIKPFVLNESCTSPSFLTLQQNLSNYTLAQLISPNPNELNILLSTVVVAAGQDQRDLLSQISIPTLICYGSIDLSVFPQNSIYMHQRIKNSILAEFCGKGHELNLTDTKNFDDLLAGFIEGKKYPCSLRLGKSGCCDVCTTAYNSTDITPCTPAQSKGVTAQKKK